MNRNILYGIIAIILIVIAFMFYFKPKEVANREAINIDSYYNQSGAVITPTSDTASSTLSNKENSTSTNNFMHRITLETNKGTIVFETYDADAPRTVENFITLANKDYYNGVIFHRVIEGFMIQGGDPTGTGMGGPGYKFEDELDPNTASAKAGYVRGTVAMANAGPNTNGSQFFIMHKDYPLPHNYTIFGRVVSGMDVVDAIATTATDQSDRPLEKIVINNVTVNNAK